VLPPSDAGRLKLTDASGLLAVTAAVTPVGAPSSVAGVTGGEDGLEARLVPTLFVAVTVNV